MSTIRVGGTLEEGGNSHALTGPLAKGLIHASTKAAVRLDSRRAAHAPQAELQNVAGSDVVELEFEGGLKLWTSWAQFQQDFPAATAREGAGDAVQLPSQLTLGSPSRGVGTWVLKALRVLDVKFETKADVAGTAARLIATALEQRLIKHPGLHRFASPSVLRLEPVNGEGTWPEDKPALVFIHGTASSTEGSFGALWAPEAAPLRQELGRLYEDRLFALEHHTLSVSPVHNALQLARQLPAGARVHLVTHSRGGLVGELLCRANPAGDREPFTPPEIALFEQDESHAPEAKLLRELGGLLKKKRIVVERFVRVACPARGTTLASERLDRWLSIVVNLVGLIPAVQTSVVYEFLTDLLLAVAKERTDPRQMPGLEAMMPDSPLVRLINWPEVQVTADLSVIAGDIEESSLWGRLKLLIPDLFYGGDHDLVVDTRSMYGGAERVKGARFFFDQGPEVNHFHYFRNERTARMLLAGLKRADEAQAGFESFTPQTRAARTLSLHRSAEPRPVVFVVPGIMGSHLKAQGDRIWLSKLKLAFGGLGKLRIDARNITPDEPIEDAYADVMEFLSQTHEVMPFAYDWRKSLLEEGRRLGEEVARKLQDVEAARQPVRILAHSMGGLVARSMMAQMPEVWDRLTRHEGGRLLMLGTPNGGSYVIPRLLVGQEKTVRLLALLDLTHSHKDLLGIIARFPGVLGMLPPDDRFDFFSREFWEKLAQSEGRDLQWCPPDPAALADARAARKLLDAQTLTSDRILYVAGRAPVTPVAMESNPKARPGERIRFLATARGDGRVPWSTGIPRNVKTWFMDVVHGDMAAHEPVFPALLELLQTGQTSRLAVAPILPERGIDEVFELPPDAVEVFPAEEDLELSVRGARRRKKAEPEALPVRVTIAHGNLAYARYPVAVGHYAGDTIISAEAYLDRVLGGRLRKRQRLGLYAGPLMTCEVLLSPNENQRPAGALVVGLGRVGELSPNALTRTVTHAALTYALAVAEGPGQPSAAAQGLPKSAKLSMLLIGSGAGGMSVQDSVMAMLRGVHRANRQLRVAGQDQQVTIDTVEFIELYEDRAILAAQALDRVNDDPDLRGWFECQTRVRRLDGARKRATYDEEAGWWNRLQVLKHEDGSLRFSAITSRARAEVRLLPTQRALVDQFIREAILSTSNNPEVAKTLFELLVPNELKEQAPDREPLVLVLDAASASYPWELLQDRWSTGSEPLAVQAGVLRQLETEVFRSQVITTTRDTALVVGDPESPFIPLPGAEAEAAFVTELLGKRGYKVESRIREASGPIIKALHADGYRILHLAGHGVHEYPLKAAQETCASCQQPRPGADKRISGMVIGDGIFLTPADVEQMRRVPELVFINCCHLGRTIREDDRDSVRTDRHEFAANLAAQFIRMGVRAVVAAGWAVDDAAATLFARRFYEELLDGTPFGEAVLAARKAVYNVHRGVNTWGAYQCYGDPDFRLVQAGAAGARTGQPRKFFAPAQVVAELETVSSRAESASGDDLKKLQADLRELAADVKRNWSASAAVQAALGRAYSDLGLFAEAIEHYQAALKVKKADCPVEVIEQLANLKGRFAVALATGGAESKATLGGKTPKTLVAEAIETLKGLQALGETSERLNLLASAYKRQAWISSGKERETALDHMRQCYEAAHQFASAQAGGAGHYPLFNLAVARLARAWVNPTIDRKELKAITDDLDRARDLATAARAEAPDFWNTMATVECDLAVRLAKGELHQEGVAESLADQYLNALKLSGSPRQLRSALDQIEFLAGLLSAAGKRGPWAGQRAALLKIRDQLKAHVG